MAKSPLERQIESQMKQAKQLADKKRREDEKRAREQKRMEQKAIVRDRASSIVNGQPLVEGFRIMDKTSEEILRCLLECDSRRDSHVNFSDDIFPSYVQMSVGVELEKLIQYGMIGGLLSFDNGGMLDLLPPAFSYFEDKQAALDGKAWLVLWRSGSTFGNSCIRTVGDLTSNRTTIVQILLMHEVSNNETEG